MTLHPRGPAEPATIGRYRVLGTLDSAAGFHELLAAAPDDTLVVVRRAAAELLGEPDFRVRMRHTAVAAMRVSGANNTTVIDVDADAERPWIASAFVPGVRLDRAVAEHGPLPVPAVRALASAMAAALRTIHAAGLVHQRLRADAVLLAADGGRLGDLGITPATGASSTGTLLGTPDFLSPEQAVGVAVTPASDVFALGSVLAFAAGGVAPFAAASVPYTLFNIAQREPDLSRVPEPLTELIAACLRKDPAARPTPAQILDYLGGPPSAPAPWPVPVRDDIGRLRDAATVLLAAAPPIEPPPSPPARPLPEALVGFGRAALERGGRAARYGRSRWHAASVVARGVLAGGLAVLLLVLGGVAYAVTRPAAEPAPVTGLSLDQLRRIDACAWLTSALGAEVPVGPAPLAAADLTLRPTSTWGCVATGKQYIFGLALGERDEYLTPNVTVVDGVPVIDGSEAACSRAIASPGADPPTGIVVTMSSPSEVEGCAGIDYLAANIARSMTTAPRAENRDSSLALLDPCALLDHDLVAAKIGRTAERPTIADAHTCQWDARVRLSVQLLRTSSLTSDDDAPTTVTDGLRIYLDKGTSSAICTRAYRASDAEEESIEVSVHGATSMREESCAIATEVLRQVVSELPAR
ncbi:serine/threonine-protein kinase [Nocardia rhizosphaerae]|uniref:Serine/threonine-protein kinase n=1 Tax=Nocardia rhizosphaerae TaxID=1691571 RepID=A0ABV8L0J3_9NOCA